MKISKKRERAVEKAVREPIESLIKIIEGGGNFYDQLDFLERDIIVGVFNELGVYDSKRRL